MAWADNLHPAESLLHKKGSLRDAFLSVFQALDTCYRSVARQREWQPGTKDESTFWAMAGWLRERKLVSADDCEMASVNAARNVVAHQGFEPSAGQVQRTIGDVRRRRPRRCGPGDLGVLRRRSHPIPTWRPSEHKRLACRGGRRRRKEEAREQVNHIEEAWAAATQTAAPEKG